MVADVPDPCLAVAAYGLAGALKDFPPEPLEPAAWQRLSGAAADHQIDGLLAAAVGDGTFPATEQQRAEIEQSHTERMTACLMLEAVLVGLIDPLVQAGVPMLVLRGASTAHLDYRNPAWRPFADIDVLVPPGMLAGADAALQSAGLKAAGRTKRYTGGERQAVTLAARYGCEVDVYDHIIGGPLGSTIASNDLWSETSVFELAGKRLSTLSPEIRVLAACLRAAVGPESRLIALRDLVQLLLQGQINVGRVHVLARQWGVQAILADGIRRAWHTFSLADVVALSIWARRYRPGLEEEKLLENYRQAAPQHQRRASRLRRLRLPASARAGKVTGSLFR